MLSKRQACCQNKCNGFAVDTTRPGAIAFLRATGALSDNIITNGRDQSEMYRAGMNSPEANENYQLLLNIIHWLDGIIKN